MPPHYRGALPVTVRKVGRPRLDDAATSFGNTVLAGARGLIATAQPQAKSVHWVSSAVDNFEYQSHAYARFPAWTAFAGTRKATPKETQAS
jgi:hypothetical protein